MFMNPLLPPLWPMIATAVETETEIAPLVLAGVLLSLVVVYFASKLGGEVCLRLNLPPVLGELVGGVLVGVSALKLLLFPEGGLAPEDSLVIQLLMGSADLSPEAAASVFSAQSEVISVISELGVIILLFEIGLESNLKELIRMGPQAAIVAVVGVVTPFSLGTIGLMTIFGVAAIPAIFAGAALTATSIGITAKVLAEINRLSSNEGQIIIGAAVLDDILGIIVLAVVGSLVKTGEIQISNIIYLILSATGFVVGSILIGRLLSPFYVSLVNRMKTRGQLLLVSICVAFVLSYIAQIVQLEAILGSFAAGLILAETEKREDLEEQILPLADFFVPVFFVCVGAKTDVSVLNPAVPANREGLIIAAFLIVVAIVGKVVTGFTLFGKSELNKLAIGVGMIPRGEVGLVFAGVGAASGALDPATDAAIIVMVIVTTFVAPPWLRAVFEGAKKEEAQEKPVPTPE
ncbi:cation:proton antiporter [Synechocystis salina]|uniref:Cation:proton antiporter n=1 Tax=Synechocystis salina LEGE 00031 TaxID=1828736 RepID=A0ABR9VPV5_9SYNC|nr:cation:proton antiporter [Synechocystis salina]MBE9240247.1 cation:proton antiporter [Synechocystis salina LEGE 00041]MBE9253387.1 cation:proton antiporter [Synechocystis salina LEGE 00031]